MLIYTVSPKVQWTLYYTTNNIWYRAEPNCLQIRPNWLYNDGNVMLGIVEFACVVLHVCCRLCNPWYQHKYVGVKGLHALHKRNLGHIWKFSWYISCKWYQYICTMVLPWWHTGIVIYYWQTVLLCYARYMYVYFSSVFEGTDDVTGLQCADYERASPGSYALPSGIYVPCYTTFTC